MDENVFLGRIEVRPPLNEPERDFLIELASSRSTLRGTPTGRGERSVPFAHLAWEACPGGCCLTWNGLERPVHLVSSLGFLVDHLFSPGAKVVGHPRFTEFTCDHVLDGVVTVREGNGRVHVAEVTGNRVGGRSIQPACAQAGSAQESRSRQRPRPANVIEFRPRRA